MSSDDQQPTVKPRGFSRRQALRLTAAVFATPPQGDLRRFAFPGQTEITAANKKGPRILVPAKPAPIDIDLSATAVIVVDMQNDFVSNGGMLDGLGDISMIQRTVAPSASVIAAARNLGVTIIYLKMAFKPDLSDVGPVDSPSWLNLHSVGVGTKMNTPDGREGRILIRDTWNTAVVRKLKPEAADIEIYKHRYSGFFETSLDATLRRLGVRYLVVVGCTTSVCVESTIRDAMFLDYSTILLADCTGEPLGNDLPRSNYDASLLVIAGRNFGWVSSSGAFLESVKRSALPI
jgi:ureidoacrylate peracid hydrolase